MLQLWLRQSRSDKTAITSWFHTGHLPRLWWITPRCRSSLQLPAVTQSAQKRRSPKTSGRNPGIHVRWERHNNAHALSVTVLDHFKKVGQGLRNILGDLRIDNSSSDYICEELWWECNSDSTGKELLFTKTKLVVFANRKEWHAYVVEVHIGSYQDKRIHLYVYWTLKQ